jgi:ADP-heptose:LPS heptosyltransferase
MSQNFMALVEALESAAHGPIPLPKQYVPPPEAAVCAPKTEESFRHVQRELAALIDLPPGAKLVVLNHDAGQLLPIRSWPVARWTELARRLLEHDPRCVVVLMGIPSSCASARAIAAEVDHPRLVDFIGKTRHLTDVINLFHQAELLITNDSGPAHFATLTDIASITLFGPETPRLYGPRGPRCVNVYKELACSPCLSAANHRHSPCTDNVCLQQITTAEVFDHAVRLLEERVRVPAGR